MGWGIRHPIGGRVELGGRVWYHVKAHHNGHNLSIENETLSRFVSEQDAVQVFGLVTRPQFGGWVELGVGGVVPRESSPNYVQSISGTETLSLSDYEPFAIHILLRGTVPQIGGEGCASGRVWHRVKVLRIRYNLFAQSETLSLFVYEPIAMHFLPGGTVPQIWGGCRARGSCVAPRESPPY